MYQFPKDLPIDNAPAVWALQQFLLTEAESCFGQKNPEKKLYQPVFNNANPHIINTPNLDGAFASLSNDASMYWPTTLFKLAHETIHLLDPVTGFTNYLEEGIAVAFSVEMSHSYTSDPQQPNDDHYQKAWELVLRLSEDWAKATLELRNKCGSLGVATPENVLALYPDTDNDLAEQLCSKCDFT